MVSFSTQPFPLNSTQLYEIMSCQCAFPTESAVAPLHPPGKNTGTFLERTGRNGARDWNYLKNVSAERHSGARGSFFHSLKHLSHVQHFNGQKIQSREVWVTSHFSTTLPAVPPRCCVDDRCLCGGVRSHLFTGLCVCPQQCCSVTFLWVSVCCSFWTLRWTLLVSLDKWRPRFRESSSERRTRAASLRSPDLSTTWKHTHTHH